MMDEGGVEVDGKSDEAMLKVICETDAGGMNHVIRVVPSDVLSTFAEHAHRSISTLPPD